MAARILWVDDEIELLKAHQIFLTAKGYDLRTESNSSDAIEMLHAEKFDIIFLDENMPGRSGLDILPEIKELCPDTPIVMITKSEEENIMEQAIGSRIADYLIKPVNPSQLLLCVKKHLEGRRLISETTQSLYQSQFQAITMQTMECQTFDDWANLYQKLVRWEIDLQNVKTLDDVQLMQKAEANNGFTRFVKKNYLSWIADQDHAPLMSNRIMSRRILPLLEKGEKVVLIVIDNCRLDQWELFRGMLSQDYDIETELYCAILPTTTQFARNAIFSGLMPSQIRELYPEYWVESDDEESQNAHEKELLQTFFDRYRKKNFSSAYYKVNNAESGEKMLRTYPHIKKNDLVALVFNFVDMLSHARTEVKMVHELASDMAAFRSITRSWFEHSALYELLLRLRDKDVKIVITTDHGSVHVSRAVKILGDRQVNSNLRYKMGKQLQYENKNLFCISNPVAAMLPKGNLTSTYVFAEGADYFCYPNNYNKFVDLYNDTFQHGGISMEEMIVPLATLTAK